MISNNNLEWYYAYIIHGLKIGDRSFLLTDGILRLTRLYIVAADCCIIIFSCLCLPRYLVPLLAELQTVKIRCNFDWCILRHNGMFYCALSSLSSNVTASGYMPLWGWKPHCKLVDHARFLQSSSSPNKQFTWCTVTYARWSGVITIHISNGAQCEGRRHIFTSNWKW